MEFDPKFPIKDLRLFHKNSRKGDVEAIKKSLTIHGQYRTVVLNRGTHTGRPMEVLAGNHTVKAARDLGWETIAVNFVDYDEDQAMRVVLVDNSLSDKATHDVDILTSVLSDLDDLEGTGYTDEDLDKLLNGLDDGEPADSEHEEEYHNRWELVIELDSEEAQREMYQELTEAGHRVRVLSL